MTGYLPFTNKPYIVKKIEDILYYIQFRQNCKNNKQFSQKEIHLIIDS